MIDPEPILIFVPRQDQIETVSRGNHRLVVKDFSIISTYNEDCFVFDRTNLVRRTVPIQLPLLSNPTDGETLCPTATTLPASLSATGCRLYVLNPYGSVESTPFQSPQLLVDIVALVPSLPITINNH